MSKQTDKVAPEEKKSLNRLKRTPSARQQQREAIGLDSTDANPEISRRDVREMKAAIEIEKLCESCTTVSHSIFCTHVVDALCSGRFGVTFWHIRSW